MPEVAAPQSKPQATEMPVVITPIEVSGGRLVDHDQPTVSNKIAAQVKELGLTHPGQIPMSAPHVDLAMQQSVDKRASELDRAGRRQPDIYEDKTELSGLAKMHDALDLADQYVTGRTHRTTDVADFNAHKKKMGEEKLQHRNSPSEEGGVLTKVGNWFLKEKKAA